MASSDSFENGYVSYSRCGQVQFPEPSDRNVNMMPFIFGDKESLPDNLQCYFPLIEQCPYMADEVGKVGFITVHESYVVAVESQRRSGLHIEAPGKAQLSFRPGLEHQWGIGRFYGPDRYDGGIFFASIVADTSMVWNALVDKNVPGIVDKHGSCEHLRGIIGEGTKLDAGELIWMTDCTPHEALIQTESGYRQFFRVITSSVSHWFAAHSTENPKVSLPSNIIVVRSDKFAQDVSDTSEISGKAPMLISGKAPMLPSCNSSAAASWISFICGSIRHIISSLLPPSGETVVETRTEIEQPQVDEVFVDAATTDEEVLPPKSEDLPPGWASSTDTASGETFYYNEETGESSWEKPLIEEADG